MSQFVGNDSEDVQLALHDIGNCTAITGDAMVACKVPIALSRSMGVNLGILKHQCVTAEILFLTFLALGMSEDRFH